VRLSSLNPLDLFFFSQDREPGELTANSMLNGTLWLRRGRMTLTGEALLDDIHVSGDPAPVRAALGGGIHVALREVSLDFQYRAVSAFTYWTFEDAGRRNADQWSYYGRGLGDNASDYDRATIRASFHPAVAGLRISPKLQLQRKGEWDFRRPSVPYEEFRTQRTLFVGVRETTLRLGLEGRYDPDNVMSIGWDIGMSRIRNAAHREGRQLTELTGSIRAGLRFSGPRMHER
jgi:hypothetical protein